MEKNLQDSLFSPEFSSLSQEYDTSKFIKKIQ